MTGTARRAPRIAASGTRIAASGTRVAAVGAVALGAIGIMLAALLAVTRPVPIDQVAHRRTTDAVRATVAAGRLLFVGASYTVGWGATRPSRGYATLVSSQLKRQATIDAVAGTGFTNPGSHNQGTFATRIARIPIDTDPRIVIIQGGRDDNATPAVEYHAVVDTVDVARHRFVHAQVVLLGPIPVKVPVYESLVRLDSAIAAGARASGAGYVDAIAQGWITPENERGYLGRIPGHPSDLGYADFARRLVADLPSALRTAADPVSPDKTSTSPRQHTRLADIFGTSPRFGRTS